MPRTSSQVLHSELDKKLWNLADWLGLIIKERRRLAHPSKITSTGELSDHALKDPENDSFADPADYPTRGGGLHPPSPNKSQEHFSNSSHKEAIHWALEERDYHIQKNVFSVPALAQSKTLQNYHTRMRSHKMQSHPAERPRSQGHSDKLPAGTVIPASSSTTRWKWWRRKTRMVRSDIDFPLEEPSRSARRRE